MADRKPSMLPPAVALPAFAAAWGLLCVLETALFLARAVVDEGRSMLGPASGTVDALYGDLYSGPLFFSVVGLAVAGIVLAFFVPRASRSMTHIDLRAAVIFGGGAAVLAAWPGILDDGTTVTPPWWIDGLWPFLLPIAGWFSVRSLRAAQKEAEPVDPDDEGIFGFKIGEHLTALREAAVRSIIVPVILVVGIWPFWEVIVRYMLLLLLTPDQRAMVVTTKIFDTFAISLQVSLYLGIALSVPWIIMNLWWFVSPGLYPHERRFGLVAVTSAIVLFAAGAAFCFYLILPVTYGYLLEFGREILPGEPHHQLIQLDDFVDWTFMMMFILGLTFLLPLVIAPAVRFGILTKEFFQKYRKFVIFAAVLLGAVITPTGDPITLTLVSVPIYLLIEGGVLLGRFWRYQAEKRRAIEEAREQAEWDAEYGSDGDPNDGGDGGDSPDGGGPGGSGPSPRPRASRPEREDTGFGGVDGLFGGKAAESFAQSFSDLATTLSTGLTPDERKQAAEAEAARRALEAPPAQAVPAAAPAPTAPSAPVAPVAPAVAAVVAPAAPPPPQPTVMAPRAPIHEPIDPAVVAAAPAAPAPTPVPSPGQQQPSPDTASPSTRPVPQLPRELRRRIDHYIQTRLDEILREALDERLKAANAADGKAVPRTDSAPDSTDPAPGTLPRA